MRSITACFTGHRFIKKESISKVEKALESTIINLISKGVIHYGCGGAIGFDMIAGYTVLKMKQRYPQINLIMVLPCENQDIKWNLSDREKYKQLVAMADKKVVLQPEYDDRCMLGRNRHLVDNSGYCIAYLTQNRGGSHYTVRYAHEKNIEIINIADQI